MRFLELFDLDGGRTWPPLTAVMPTRTAKAQGHEFEPFQENATRGASASRFQMLTAGRTWPGRAVPGALDARCSRPRVLQARRRARRHRRRRETFIAIAVASIDALTADAVTVDAVAVDVAVIDARR